MDTDWPPPAKEKNRSRKFRESCACVWEVPRRRPDLRAPSQSQRLGGAANTTILFFAVRPIRHAEYTRFLPSVSLSTGRGSWFELLGGLSYLMRLKYGFAWSTPHSRDAIVRGPAHPTRSNGACNGLCGPLCFSCTSLRAQCQMCAAPAGGIPPPCRVPWEEARLRGWGGRCTDFLRRAPLVPPGVCRTMPFANANVGGDLWKPSGPGWLCRDGERRSRRRELTLAALHMDALPWALQTITHSCQQS
eukprot:gene10313-biopygen1756